MKFVPFKPPKMNTLSLEKFMQIFRNVLGRFLKSEEKNAAYLLSTKATETKAQIKFVTNCSTQLGNVIKSSRSYSETK